MPQSLSSILIHLIFSTKNREPFITNEIAVELHPYMATILRELKSPSLAIDGTTDHVHVLFALSRTITVAAVVEEVKTSTSKWTKTKGRTLRNFQWQRGYRRILNRPIDCTYVEAIHSQPTRTPSSRVFSGRISEISKGVQD